MRLVENSIICSCGNVVGRLRHPSDQKEGKGEKYLVDMDLVYIDENNRYKCKNKMCGDVLELFD